MIERHTDHSEYLQFESLAHVPSLVHAVFTRRRGFSSGRFAGLNASSTTGDDMAVVRRNKAAIVEAIGLPLVGARPVHGARVATVERGDLDGTGASAAERLQARLRYVQADAMMSDVPGFAFCWAYGDCAPILLYDPQHRALAMVHAGWRGTAAAIVPATVRAMTERYSTQPHDLLAGIGPAIGSCCYEVSEQVREAFAANPLAWETARFECRPEAASERGPGLFLDIAGSNYRQLLAAGVLAEHIEDSGYCTGCRTDLFFSNRREPPPSGRFAVAIGLRTL